jgi:hypothetical protein
MHIPLLIMNVQIFSLDMDARCLTSNEAILQYDKYAVIKIPLRDAHPVNGGPVVGEYYFVRYRDGITQETYPPEFRYIGAVNGQLVFSST